MELWTLARGVLGACFTAGILVGCIATLDGEGAAGAGSGLRAPPDRARFQVGTCAQDEMRERVCGELTAPVDVAADAPFWDCPADPKQLTRPGPAMLFYTDTKKLELDRHLTLQYRKELNANCGADDPDRKGFCCFSRCSPLPVAAGSTRALPAGHEDGSICVDAPEGGTRHPAADYPECPNALVLGIGPLPAEADPFDAEATATLRLREADYFADRPRCCYRTPVPSE